MRHWKKILTVVTSVSLLTACNAMPKTVSQTQKISQDQVQSENATYFLERAPKYVQDDTTEVLVDAEIKPEDIRRIVKHGDHWHVFTKDGRERITYTDPTAATSKQVDAHGHQHNAQASQQAFVSVVSLSQLSKLPISKILQHGDHYHCYTADGTEYITYENPSRVFANIKIGTYVGSHGQHQVGNMQLGKAPNGTLPEALTMGTNHKPNSTGKAGDPNEVVKILQHGDHWHVYTRGGSEFITYSDPSGMYPNASRGTYVGSHGPLGGEHNFNGANQGDNNINPGNNWHNNQYNPSPSFNGGSNNSGIVQVVSVEQLKNLNITTIKKHGDHYHCYTASGNEYITYDDPSSAFPGITIGTYVGSHGGSGHNNQSSNTGNYDQTGSSTSSTFNYDQQLAQLAGKKIYAVGQHGDHVHVFYFTGANTLGEAVVHAHSGDTNSVELANAICRKFTSVIRGDYETIKQTVEKVYPKTEEQKQKEQDEEAALIEGLKDGSIGTPLRIKECIGHWHIYYKDKQGNQIEKLVYRDITKIFPNLPVERQEHIEEDNIDKVPAVKAYLEKEYKGYEISNIANKMYALCACTGDHLIFSLEHFTVENGVVSYTGTPVQENIGPDNSACSIHNTQTPPEDKPSESTNTDKPVDTTTTESDADKQPAEKEPESKGPETNVDVNNESSNELEADKTKEQAVNAEAESATAE